MCMLIALFVLTAVTTLANGEDTSSLFECRATELEQLKTRMIGWFDMIRTESREENHRSHHSHFDQLSKFHNKKGYNLGKPELGHHDKQSMFRRKRGIVEKESYGGCTCSKSVMLEFRRQDTSEDGHLNEYELSVMSANRREPCMKHLFKSCDKDSNGNLARGEWCCCFQEIVAPCFEKKKQSNPDEWIPSCNTEGYFEREQCHKDGSCWCVDLNGNMIEGTKTKQGKADCGKFGPSGYKIKP